MWFHRCKSNFGTEGGLQGPCGYREGSRSLSSPSNTLLEASLDVSKEKEQAVTVCGYSLGNN